MKTFRYSFFFTFLISIVTFYYSFSQNQIDSLEIELERVVSDTLRINILNSIGYLTERTAPKKSLDYSNKAIELSKEIGYPFGIGQGLNNRGVVYNYQGNYKQALEDHINAMKIREKISDSAGIAASIANIGLTYYFQKELWKAVDHIERALSMYQQLNHKLQQENCYINLGGMYFYLDSLNLALEYFNQALVIQKNRKEGYQMGLSYNNIGAIYEKQNKSVKAEEYFQLALDIFTRANDKTGLVLSLSNLGNIFSEKKMSTKAISYFERALSISREINSKTDIEISYLNLSNEYSKLGHYKKAYEYHDLYTAIKDSIFNEESAKSMNEMQAKYESEKKEKEIGILTKDNELQALKTAQQEDKIKKQRYLIIGIVFIVILAFSLVYFVFSQFNFKKQANYELEFKNDQLGMINRDLGRKNKSIAESINYAQRIQETIMPTQNHLNGIFHESFIFYKAKDVISGDFPWVWTSLDEKGEVCVSVVDCTGHGVPGAMMSMIGYFLLNDIVASKKIHDPAIILEELHNGIKNTLRQEENLESKDGMDIAFCAINKENRQVHYAGAHRSLLWLHNGEIEEIQGDRFPVGGLQYSSRGKEIKFKNHKLQLTKGDSIYFYSDGLVDQIGGPKGRRFQNNQVKEIIIENKGKPMEEM
ncbi:MAG: tetratricopeptide repeat protein [Bacteroidia bacterium]|nr:tetratricopeptide repeat protein [Bacteroidia bacterium]